jgi:hypothetical protein
VQTGLQLYLSTLFYSSTLFHIVLNTTACTMHLHFRRNEFFPRRKKKHLSKNSLNRTDDVLHYPYFCSDKCFGEYNFCEAVKVDLSIQRSTQTKEQNYERYVSNSMSLVKVLFEEMRPAIDCIDDLGRQTMKAKLDQHFTPFNNEKKGPMKDTHLICRMELTLNYPLNKMNHSKFLNHGVFSFIG